MNKFPRVKLIYQLRLRNTCLKAFGFSNCNDFQLVALNQSITIIFYFADEGVPIQLSTKNKLKLLELKINKLDLQCKPSKLKLMRKISLADQGGTINFLNYWHPSPKVFLFSQFVQFLLFILQKQAKFPKQNSRQNPNKSHYQTIFRMEEHSQPLKPSSQPNFHERMFQKIRPSNQTWRNVARFGLSDEQPTRIWSTASTGSRKQKLYWKGQHRFCCKQQKQGYWGKAILGVVGLLTLAKEAQRQVILSNRPWKSKLI